MSDECNVHSLVLSFLFFSSFSYSSRGTCSIILNIYCCTAILPYCHNAVKESIGVQCVMDFTVVILE